MLRRKLSADGKTIFYQSGTTGVAAAVTSDFGKTWTTCEGLPAGAVIETDKVNPDKFYGSYDGTFYMSTDGGKTFSPITNMLVSATSIKACPDTEGDLWISVGAGGVYYLDTATGTLASTSQDVTQCDAIGLGKAEKDGDYMALYMMGEANGDGYGIYMSADKGVTWKRINDDTQKWGNVRKIISGDPKVYGRVYVGTDGRGIIMGNVKQ